MIRNRKFVVVVLVLFLILIITQVPFIWRRMQLRNAAERIAATDAQGARAATDDLREYKGVIHVHTAIGGHSTGTVEELLRASEENNLDFVVMTEHIHRDFDTTALTPNGKYGNTLFIAGNEIDTLDGNRLLIAPGGADATAFHYEHVKDALETLHNTSRLAFVTYPKDNHVWDANYDGYEALNLGLAFKKANPVTAFFDFIWSFGAYPELTTIRSISRPDAELAQYDELTTRRRLSLLSGLDAHSNLGFHLFGDDAGTKFVQIKIDPYKKIFNTLRLHALLKSNEELSRETLLAALKEGHFFTGVDCLGDTTGFRFHATEAAGDQLMGSEISMDPGLSLTATLPLPGEVVVLKNGNVFQKASSTDRLTFHPDGPGTYRVEVYRSDIGDALGKFPWILSNPIYVR